MKISIITPVFNAKDSIEIALKSVIRQKKLHNIEYVVVDGGSTDGTLSILKKYTPYIDVFISEKDNGLYDALNKGIKISSGDYIIILAADDFFLNDSISSFLKSVNSKTDVWCGSVVIKNNNGFYYNFSEPNLRHLFKRCSLRNPATFFRRDLFKKYGYYDQKYKIAADREFFLRLYKYNENVKFQIENYPIVFFSMTGLSNVNKKVFKEDFSISVMYGLNKIYAYLLFISSSNSLLFIIKKTIKKCILFLTRNKHSIFTNNYKKVDENLVAKLGLKDVF